MPEDLLIPLAGIVVLGALAQWTSWRIGLPSILLLLAAGLVAGPWTGFIDPDALLGDLLFPIVSLSVALILYEGGLTLKLGELRRIGPVVRNLVTIGAIVSWALIGLTAHYFAGLSISLSVLLGAILVVTGPTVVAPLLRQVKPHAPIGSILKWEGILIDPIGATLVVLVFEAVHADVGGQMTTGAILGLGKTLLVGGGLGAVAAIIMVLVLKRFWVPDHLHNMLSMAMVFATFTAANSLQHESGLLAVTLMGVIMANQKSVNVRHIIEFKENLQVLLISTLFILLAARIDPQQFREISAGHLLFLASVIVVIRPISVFLSTLRSELNWRQRLFLAWIAPRGIVAAAVASVFSIRLVDSGHADGAQLVPVTFLVIVGSIAAAGLTASPLARWLGVGGTAAGGILIVGAHTWARTLADTLKQAGVPVFLVDTNWTNVTAARMAGLTAHLGNIMSDNTIDDLPWEQIGKFMALTPNDQANALAARHLREFMSRAEIYRLPPRPTDDEPQGSLSHHDVAGRMLFGESATFEALGDRFGRGFQLKIIQLTDEFDFAAFEQGNVADALPMFLVAQDGALIVAAADRPLDPKPGQKLIALVKGADDPPAASVD